MPQRFDQMDPAECAYSVTVQGFKSETIGETYRLSTGKSFNVMASQKIVMKSENDMSFDTSKGLSIDASKSASINSATSIELSCGKSSLVLREDGVILLKGKQFFQDISENVEIDAEAHFAVKSSKIDMN